MILFENPLNLSQRVHLDFLSNYLFYKYLNAIEF